MPSEGPNKVIKFSRLFFKERQGFQSCETAVVLSMCGPEKIFHHTTSYNAHLVNNAALKKQLLQRGNYLFSLFLVLHL